MVEFKDNVKRVIKERGFKQCAIAEKAGSSKKAFNDMMSGRKVIRDTDIVRICYALDVTPNELFKDVGNVKPV